MMTFPRKRPQDESKEEGEKGEKINNEGCCLNRRNLARGSAMLSH